MSDNKINDLYAYCNKVKSHNYAALKIRKRFEATIILEAIKGKMKSRRKCPQYVNRYTWLTVYDDEINFLIDTHG